MSVQPKILFVNDPQRPGDALKEQLGQHYQVVEVSSPLRALAHLTHQPFDGVYVTSNHLSEALQLGRLLQNERILEGMPDGVVLLDAENMVIWANVRVREWSVIGQTEGSNFYQMLGSPEILGPDFCPFHTVLATGRASTSTLRTSENRYYRVHAAPVHDGEDSARNLIVTLRDVSNEVQQQQKLEAIHQAGVELADLKPEELLEMSAEERIELLKSNILHHTKDLLKFDTIEVRLLDQETGRLAPLLSVGMEPVAANRDLFAKAQENGVTGFVAATGKSYLCEDTTQDPLYIKGAKGARSSLTVPLILHDEVIGSFNVESPKPRAFSESDMQFLEIFSRDLAVAVNTLDLLAAENASTAARSCEAIHSAVALPVDEILNDTVNVMERYIGHDPEVVERLQRILHNARDIKQVIQKVGQKMAPAKALPQARENTERPTLRGCQVLVVDADDSVRSAAHGLLERYGCIVETAHDGEEAVGMVRAFGATSHYECIISDIRLPDMSGYELLLKLREINEPMPLVLMTGFGYDPGHTIVKARQAGLKSILYKPFRLDQLLETVEQTIRDYSPV